MGPKKTKTSPKKIENPPPDWPPFRPLMNPIDLSLSTVVSNQIVVSRNFFTSALCKNYVSFLKTLPLATTPGKPKKGDALRYNNRFQINDEAFANRLWLETGLKQLICGMEDEEDRENLEQEDGEMTKAERRELWGGEVVGLNPSIRIYQYTKGQFFDCHYDESNVITLNTKPTPTPAKTTWTLLLYLTSPATGCQGGETVFYPDEIAGKSSPLDKEIVVSLETGMLLLHKHGNDCMLHEGREVTEGEKVSCVSCEAGVRCPKLTSQWWVIRSDLCVRREKTKGVF